MSCSLRAGSLLLLPLALCAACADAAKDADSTPGETGPGETGAPTDTQPTGDTTGDTTSDTTGDTGGEDADGDGYHSDLDCDDADPTVHPGADERCNGLDDDCDGEVSEDGVVSVDGAGSYRTIGEAIAVAPTGAEVRVCAGTWDEGLYISKDLSLVSQEGATATVIDGGGAGTTLRVTGGEVHVEGFTLTGGFSFGLGGGLSVTGTDPVTVVDAIITGNTSSDGGGVYAYAGAQLSLIGTEITENIAEIGAGVFMSSDGGDASLRLDDCDVRANVAGEAGGGFHVDRVPVFEVSSTRVADNEAPDGAGFNLTTSDLTLMDSTVSRNLAGSRGGGANLYVDATGGSLVSSTSDWGSGADDNSPDDLYVFGVGSYDGLESFACDASGCE